MNSLVRPVGAALAGLALALALSFAFLTGPARAAETAAASSAQRIYFPNKLYPDTFVQKRGVFRVKLVGYQLTRWNLHSAPDGVCTGASSGSGFERVVFRSPARRMKLSAFGEPRLTSMILPRMKVRGQLTRRGSTSYTPPENPDPNCPYGDGGGDQEPILPDCGTRKYSGIPISLFALDGFFQLRSEASIDARPYFRKCPNLATKWPTIITKRTNGKPIQTRFPGRLVFNRKFNRKTGKWSKVIVIAKGVDRRRSFSSSSVTRLQWTLTLKRLR